MIMKYTMGYLIAVMMFMTGCVVAINTEDRELTDEERVELETEIKELEEELRAIEISGEAA